VSDPAPILVIDDDPTAGELTCRRLQKSGLEADYHKGPFGSLAAFERGDYRVVVLDVMMPGLSGTNLIQGLWERDVTERPRVLLYSSLDNEALRKEAETHGADAWLNKGATRGELAAAVRALLDTPADA
jgi:DNA-binding response OmpR family regulator